MILRRLYLLVPNLGQAEASARDLMGYRVNRHHIHAIARPGVDLGSLPVATLRQRNDFVAKLERWVWDINLGIFFVALVVLAASLWSAQWSWAIGATLVAVANVYLGYRFAQQVPHTHVEDCQTPLRHGEILLLVDVPRWRISEVERRLRAGHPEVEIGGVGWGWDAIGI
jgi:hypothetical protein